MFYTSKKKKKVCQYRRKVLTVFCMLFLFKVTFGKDGTDFIVLPSHTKHIWNIHGNNVEELTED